MKFAVFDNIRIEAAKGAKGNCACCGKELIAKCGNIRINHWSHKGNRRCDHWWENETNWHRSWKNNFPSEYQEVLITDEKTNEKHIADVHTSHGLVIEFQHSHINPQERNGREKFYQNMVWVVDGMRLKRDYLRFAKAKKYFRNTGIPHVFAIRSIEECFPSAWLASSVPVIFDFQGAKLIDNDLDLKTYLYCLFPIRVGADSIIAEIPCQAFIRNTKNGEWSLRVRRFMEKLGQQAQAIDNLAKLEKSIQEKIAFSKFTGIGKPKRRRRF